MAINARDTEPGKMYRPTKHTSNIGGNVWYERSKTSAAKYIQRLQVRLNGCTGRHMFMMAQFKSDPEHVLFTRYMRGSDTFSGKYEVSQKVLLAPDYRLREIKWKPGYTRASTPASNAPQDTHEDVSVRRADEAFERVLVKEEDVASAITSTGVFDNSPSEPTSRRRKTVSAPAPTGTKSQSAPSRRHGTKSTPLDALRTTPLTSEDALQDAVDQAIKDKGK